jgi:hypothetical protein
VFVATGAAGIVAVPVAPLPPQAASIVNMMLIIASRLMLFLALDHIVISSLVSPIKNQENPC